MWPLEKKASYSFNELMFDHSLVMLVKQRRHTIRAGGLVGAKTKKGLFYFCRTADRAYSNIVFLSDNRAYKACNIIGEQWGGRCEEILEEISETSANLLPT
jgi:hypothetical protein